MVPLLLLHNNVVGHRQSEPGTFAGRLSSEEWIEHLRPHIGRDSGAVVTNANFDPIAEVSGSRAQDGLKSLVETFRLRSVAA